jgi:hypothetical protein
MLSLRIKGPETSQPCCRRCLGLGVVRVEVTRPFPVFQVVGYVIPSDRHTPRIQDAVGILSGLRTLGVRPWRTVDFFYPLEGQILKDN